MPRVIHRVPFRVEPGESHNEALVKTINFYWQYKVAVNNDGPNTSATMMYGVPIKTDMPTQYNHEAVVHVKWEGKKLVFTRGGR